MIGSNMFNESGFGFLFRKQNGKTWILSRATDQARAQVVAEHLLQRVTTEIGSIPFEHKLHIVYLVNDLLHHCQRKGNQI